MARTSTKDTRVVPTSVVRSCLQSKGRWLDERPFLYCIIRRPGATDIHVPRHRRGSGFFYLRDLLQLVPEFRAEFIEASFEEPRGSAEPGAGPEASFSIRIERGQATDEEVAEFMNALEELDRATGAKTLTPCITAEMARNLS